MFIVHYSMSKKRVREHCLLDTNAGGKVCYREGGAKNSKMEPTHR